MSANHLGRLARRWIRAEWLDQLGEPFVQDLEVAMEAHRKGNVSTIVFLISKALGDPPEMSEDLGIAAHLFYCAVGLVDDIQDGDANAYLKLPMSLQINAALCLRELATWKIQSVLRHPRALMAISSMIMATIRMTSSQELELSSAPQDWTVERYDRVARDAAGAELSFLLYLVGVQHRALAESLRAAGEAMGVILQIDCDLESADPRIIHIPASEVDRMRANAFAEFEAAVSELPDSVRFILSNALGRNDKRCLKITQ